MGFKQSAKPPTLLGRIPFSLLKLFLIGCILYVWYPPHLQLKKFDFVAMGGPRRGAAPAGRKKMFSKNPKKILYMATPPKKIYHNPHYYFSGMLIFTYGDDSTYHNQFFVIIIYGNPKD